MRMSPWGPPYRQALEEISQRLSRIEQNQEAIMSGLSDLTTNQAQESADVTTLLGVVTTFIADVKAALANDDSDAAVEAVAQLVAQQDAQVQAITAQLQAADPGAPATPVTPVTAS